MKTDLDIIEDLRQDKRDAFYLVFDYYNNMLVSFAKYTIHNHLLAEDFVQDAFCSLWENRTKLREDQSIQNYLFKIVRCRCIDYLRKINSQDKYSIQVEWKLKELALTQTPFENIIISGIISEEVQALIQLTIQNLPSLTGEIFKLSRNEQLKNNEIAERMGLSVKDIEYHIGKALKQFRSALKEFL